MALHVPGELHEVVEAFVQDPMQPRHVHLQVAVHEHVAKPRHGAEAIREVPGQDAQGAELVERRCVVRSVPTSAGHEVRRYVEGALGAELETAFHGP